MPKALSPFFNQELDQASIFFESGDLFQCWHHLERAHILGQPYPVSHSIVHWKMLMFGIQTKNAKEVLGQIPRLLFGGVKSFVGKIPVGNTGGANVPPLRSMSIPEELQQIIQSNT